MTEKDIKPIPKYMLKLIEKRDKQDSEDSSAVCGFTVIISSFFFGRGLYGFVVCGIAM